MIEKVLNLIKSKILGITVTIGVCTFLDEALLQHKTSFSLTKYAAVLIFFAAVYSKYNHKFASTTIQPKGKYDLNWGILKAYLQKRLNEAPVQILIFSILFLVPHNKTYLKEYAILWLIGFVELFFSFAQRQNHLTNLAEKGLTEEKANREEFLKQWGENRERGLLKYCIIDGGVIAGFLLALPISLIGFCILSLNDKQPFANGPDEIFQFIGVNFLLGAAVGIIFYRITWHFKQKRFIRLITTAL